MENLENRVNITIDSNGKTIEGETPLFSIYSSDSLEILEQKKELLKKIIKKKKLESQNKKFKRIEINVDVDPKKK